MSPSRMGNIAFFSSILISSVYFDLLTQHFSKVTAKSLTSILIIDVAVIRKYFVLKEFHTIFKNDAGKQTGNEINAYSWRIFKDHALAGMGAGTF